MNSKEVKICPFDESHLIDPSKFLKHLQKCKSPNRKEFEQCQYNAQHYVHYTQIQKHQKQCSKKFKASSKSNNSYLSSIHNYEQSHDDEFIREINMGLVGQKVLPHDLFAKDIKKVEKMSNEEERWKEPDFNQWYKRRKIMRRVPERKNNVNNFFDPDDSF